MRFLNLYAVLFFCCTLLIGCGKDSGNIPLESDYSKITDTVSPPNLAYGINIDLHSMERKSIKRNEFLTKMLTNIKLPYAQANKIAEAIEKVYDYRQMRRGNEYIIFRTNDSLQTPAYMVYVIDNKRYLRTSLQPPFKAQLIERNIDIKEEIKEVTIQTNLWNACKSNNLPHELTLALSEIYAWSIDFFGIEKGDRVKVIYKSEWIDDQCVGLSEIVAANFTHRGEQFYAFAFEDDSIKSFYDVNGNSLRKSFLKAPLNYSRITSRFSKSRMHPVLKIRRPHNGVDYAAPTGTPIMTIGDGTVIAKGYDRKGGGNFIKVRHNSTYTSVYMHLKAFAKGLQTGQKVTQGEVIGFVGATGLATGPHLDFRIYMDGKPVDPLKVQAPPVQPVSNDNMERFLEMAENLRKKL